jgi:site-specific DNA recombinase
MTDGTRPDYVLYLRKSKGRAGISRQRTITTAHIGRIGGTITAEFADGDRTAYRKPGATAQPEREEFGKMLAFLGAHPGTGIAAYHADRISRDTEVTEDLIRTCMAGRHLVETPSGGSYDLSTATGRKRLRQDAVDAAYEVDHMSERRQAEKWEVAQNGEWRGGRRPFGYAADGITLRADEAQLLSDATRAVIGGQSLGAIARQWNAAGVLTATGGPWQARQLARTLKRARNAGLIEHDGQVVGPAIWQPVVTEREWRAVCAVLSDPARRTSPGNGRRWLLSGIARCGICGNFLTGSTTGSSRGTSRPVYRCRTKGLHVGRAAQTLDDHVSGFVTAFLCKPEITAAIEAAMPSPGTAFLRSELAAVEAELLGLADMAGTRQITALQLARSTRPLLAEKESLEAKIAAASRPAVLSPFADGDPHEVWDCMPLASRRAVIAELFTITVNPAPKGRTRGWRPGMPYFDAASVVIEQRVD